MKTYGGVELQLNAFLNSALYGREWLVSYPGRDRAVVTSYI